MLIFLPMTSPEIVLGASLLAPGIMAALFLAFALSVDDFVITNVNAGAEVTFPMYVWGAARVGVPPQVNVIGTVIFLLAIVAMLGNVLLQMRRKGTT
jgi:spermidine/putrescine transport system permease protein